MRGDFDALDKSPEQLLEDRARALAQVPAQKAPGLALTLFERLDQLYGLRLAEVEGAGRLKDLSPVPGAPEWLVGAILHRGRVVSMIDLPSFWGLQQRGVADLPTFVVITDGRSRVGFLVEDLLGVHELPDAPSAYQGVERSGLVEVARRAERPVLVLSARKLFEDPRLSEGARG